MFDEFLLNHQNLENLHLQFSNQLVDFYLFEGFFRLFTSLSSFKLISFSLKYRLGLNLKGNCTHLLTIFSSLEQFSTDIERVVLFDNDPSIDEDGSIIRWKHPDDEVGSFLVNFVLKIKRLVALFLGFFHFETAQMNDLSVQ